MTNPERYDESITATIIGNEITEVLEEKPGSFEVIQYVHPKFAKENNEGVATANLLR